MFLAAIPILAGAVADTTFFDKKWRPCHRDSAAFFRPQPKPDGALFSLRDYYINGQLQMDGHLSSISPQIREGVFLFYDQTGVVTGREQFVHNKAVDTSRYYVHGKRHAERIYNNDTSYVFLKFFDTVTGQLLREGANIHNFESGLWRYYASNGALRRTGFYLNGKVHDCMTTFDTVTGLVKIESVYMNDTLLHRSYFTSSGKLHKDGAFRNGEIDGLVHEYDTVTGSIRKVYTFSSGKMNGPYKKYSATGIVYQTGNYKDGDLYGCMTNYDTGTGKMIAESVYLDNAIRSLCTYSGSGNLFKCASYHMGEVDGIVWQYDTLTGKISSQYTYQKGVMQGAFVTYLSDCEKIQCSGELVDGQLSGSSKYYYHCSDQLMLSTSLKAGKKEGLSVVYDKQTGNVVGRGTFLNDMMEGKWENYYPAHAARRRSVKQFKSGRLDGPLLSWWPDGGLRRKETYNSGTLDSWQCFSRNGKDTIYYPFFAPATFLKEPQYYIDHWAKYPDSLKSDLIIGVVHVEFLIDPDAHIVNVRIVKSSNSLFDSEALRVCRSIPVLKPGTEEGIPVLSYRLYRLTFTPPE